MNTLLIGKAEERDLIRPEIRRMLDNEGIYVCADLNYPNYPMFRVVIVSVSGKLWSTKIDRELDPERFLESVIVAGPFDVCEQGNGDASKRNEDDLTRDEEDSKRDEEVTQ